MQVKKILNNIKKIWNKLDNIYPIGSVYITSTNTNPSAKLGGTWELVDKEFTVYKNGEEGVQKTTNVNSITVVVIRQGHSVFIRASYIPSVNLTDATIELFAFKQSTFGLKKLDAYYARYFLGQTDGRTRNY